MLGFVRLELNSRDGQWPIDGLQPEQVFWSPVTVDEGPDCQDSQVHFPTTCVQVELQSRLPVYRSEFSPVCLYPGGRSTPSRCVQMGVQSLTSCVQVGSCSSVPDSLCLGGTPVPTTRVQVGVHSFTTCVQVGPSPLLPVSRWESSALLPVLKRKSSPWLRMSRRDTSPDYLCPGKRPTTITCT